MLFGLGTQRSKLLWDAPNPPFCQPIVEAKHHLFHIFYPISNMFMVNILAGGVGGSAGYCVLGMCHILNTWRFEIYIIWIVIYIICGPNQ